MSEPAILKVYRELTAAQSRVEQLERENRELMQGLAGTIETLTGDNVRLRDVLQSIKRNGYKVAPQFAATIDAVLDGKHPKVETENSRLRELLREINERIEKELGQ